MSPQKNVGTENRIEIYQFYKYDITTDENVPSKKWGTIPAIESVGGNVLRDTKILVSLSDVDADGFTVKDYKPK
ncbi:hypothetical protein J1780_13860 [Rahnella aceris]|uniref:hypothetical protein n=1 Tax=Rahnella sp. (strain Y9602) TaxID=2703885 RepID=UPI001C267360|nr:hypothetical protein [Rahnella aceris]MBU9841028.1 hypothetical protein [Rahnella aceris]